MVTLKELTKDEYFGPGHRMCAGCGSAATIRIAMKAATQASVVVNATGCLEVASTIYPYTAWGKPWVHGLFENAPAIASGIEGAFNSFRRRNLPAPDGKILVLAGDGGTFDIGLQALSGAMERRQNFTYICYDNEAYMNCVPGGTFIMTQSGLKRVDEIKAGEMIYAFAMTTNNPVLRACVGVLDNGVRPVYEMTTLHHNIRATPNHPFLVVKRRGRGKERKLAWKTLSQLNVGDEIVALKNLNGNDSYQFAFSPVQKGDRKVNKLNEIKIPNRSSSQLLEFLGLFVGDGWVRARKGEMGFAIPDGPERRILLELRSKLFGSELAGYAHGDYLYFYSVNLARFIDSLGFGKGAKNKTIPSWVFMLPTQEKEAFVRGLLYSDGYRYENSYRYVSSSFELLRKLRLLLQTMNYRVGKIHRQTVEKGKRFPHRTMLQDTAFGYICFSRKGKWNIEKYRNQYRYQDPLIESENFDVERIRGVQHIGQMRTYDLRVERDHNFIADGIVVHNTGIQRSGATPLFASTTTSPVGRAVPGKREWKKDLAAISVAHGIDYVATASPAYWQDYLTKVKKAMDTEGPALIHVIAPCPLGWRFPTDQTIKLARLAVLTRYFPLYEVDHGTYKLTTKIARPLPLEDFLRPQGRFQHLFRPENNGLLRELSRRVEENWNRMVKLCGPAAS